MIYKDVKDLLENIRGAFSLSHGVLAVEDKIKAKKCIDDLVYNLCLNDQPAIKGSCAWIIWEGAQELGAYPSSIQGLYEAKGAAKYSKVTVPAVNIRGLTYDVARALIRSAMNLSSLTLVFEIAKSEMQYTFQRPQEYSALCLAAAIKEGFTGPLFIQGDHFQLKEKVTAAIPKKKSLA